MMEIFGLMEIIFVVVAVVEKADSEGKKGLFIFAVYR